MNGERLEILTFIANTGIYAESIPEIGEQIDAHLYHMEAEKAHGKPSGETVWALYLTILHKLIVRKQLLEAQEQEEFFPLPYSLR